MVAKRRIIATEHQEQAAVIEWWKVYAVSKKINPKLLIMIPNAQILMGSARNKHAVMAYLRAEGFQDHAPDLFLAIPKMVRGMQLQAMLFAGLFIEIKRKGEKAKPGQIEFSYMLRQQDYNCIIAEFGADEAIRAIRAYIET